MTAREKVKEKNRNNCRKKIVVSSLLSTKEKIGEGYNEGRLVQRRMPYGTDNQKAGYEKRKKRV